MSQFGGIWNGEWDGVWQGGEGGGPTFANMAMVTTGQGSLVGTLAANAPAVQPAGGWFDYTAKPRRKRQEPVYADMAMAAHGNGRMVATARTVRGIDVQALAREVEGAVAAQVKRRNADLRRKREEEALLLLM